MVKFTTLKFEYLLIDVSAGRLIYRWDFYSSLQRYCTAAGVYTDLCPGLYRGYTDPYSIELRASSVWLQLNGALLSWLCPVFVTIYRISRTYGTLCS